MDPTLGGLLGRVQALKQSIRNPHSDTQIGPGKRFEDKWVGVEQLHSGNVVRFQELDDLGRRQWVRGRRAPIHAYGSGPVSHCGQEEDDQGEIWWH